MVATNVADLTRALVGRQLAYVQGVSNWNFDVAELKARAALEDPLPTVPERALAHLSPAQSTDIYAYVDQAIISPCSFCLFTCAPLSIVSCYRLDAESSP